MGALHLAVTGVPLTPSSGNRNPPHGPAVPSRVIARVKSGPEAEGWTELEAAVLRAADELQC